MELDWAYDFEEDAEPPYWQVYGDNGTVCWLDPSPNAQEWACLIAAAPDLLVALERYGRHDIQCLAGAYDGREDTPCNCGLRAAIAKAKGEVAAH